MANWYSDRKTVLDVNLCICQLNYHTDHMQDFLTLFAHLVITLDRLMGPGGARCVVA